MDCNVSVKSTYGKGSQFSLRLPRCAPQTDTSSKKTATNSAFSGLRILCVDDQQENLDALQVLLERWGVTVIIAQNGNAAKKLAKQHSPQIVLMDYQLGNNENGLELIEEMRQMLDIVFPACLVTAVRDNELIAKCKEHGVHFMNKPLKPAKLRALLQSMTRYIDEAAIIESKRQ